MIEILLTLCSSMYMKVVYHNKCLSRRQQLTTFEITLYCGNKNLTLECENNCEYSTAIFESIKEWSYKWKAMICCSYTTNIMLIRFCFLLIRIVPFNTCPFHVTFLLRIFRYNDAIIWCCYYYVLCMHCGKNLYLVQSSRSLPLRLS